MFKVIVDFKEMKFSGVNGEDPQKVAQKIKELVLEGNLKPELNEIAVFDSEDEIGFEPPIFVLKSE